MTDDELLQQCHDRVRAMPVPRTMQGLRDALYEVRLAAECDVARMRAYAAFIETCEYVG